MWVGVCVCDGRGGEKQDGHGCVGVETRQDKEDKIIKQLWPDRVKVIQVFAIYCVVTS